MYGNLPTRRQRNSGQGGYRNTQ